MSDLTLRQLADDIRANARPLVVLVVVALVMVLNHYMFDPARYETFRGPTDDPLARFWWWTGGLLVIWVLVPMLVCFGFGMPLHEQGLDSTGLAPKLWIYAVLYALAMLPVTWAAMQPAFIDQYPLLRRFGERDIGTRMLVNYWSLYAMQFICVEYFFRGFMISALRPRFGLGAVAIMIAPYTMLHFQKPLPEALGAIVAGLVLGYLAYRTRSIWGGVLVHIAVAISMDVLVMLQQPEGLPDGLRWW